MYIFVANIFAETFFGEDLFLQFGKKNVKIRTLKSFVLHSMQLLKQRP